MFHSTVGFLEHSVHTSIGINKSVRSTEYLAVEFVRSWRRVWCVVSRDAAAVRRCCSAVVLLPPAVSQSPASCCRRASTGLHSAPHTRCSADAADATLPHALHTKTRCTLTVCT